MVGKQGEYCTLDVGVDITVFSEVLGLLSVRVSSVHDDHSKL